MHIKIYRENHKKLQSGLTKLHFDYIQNKSVTLYRQSAVFLFILIVENKQLPVESCRVEYVRALVIMHK